MDRNHLPLIRPLVAGVTVVGGLIGTAALLSDRVPIWLGLARNRFDAPGWFPWALDDKAFHLALWLGITLMATLAVRTTRVRLLVGGATAAAGLLIEYLQIRWTITRSFEISDVAANVRGVYLGLLSGLVIGAVIDALENRRQTGSADAA
ncbi:MAG: hypothetical protein MUP76_00110 [Acidimicrobiia bacterium]|nr:hypothetical protein [Acidimicrobiia bacterium]